jgi:CBS domain-containing membrane protein
MRSLKDRGQARATGLMLQLAGWLPAPLHALLGRVLPATTPLNTVTTNVPGPREACHMLGRRIEEVHPIVPLFDGMGVEFAIMSYAERLSICAVADPVLVPDAAELATHLHAAAGELLDALGTRKAAPAEPPVAEGIVSIAALMQSRVVTLVPNDRLATAWSLMSRHRIRHLPVVTPDGRLIGMVTHRDLLAASPSSLAPQGERVTLSGAVRVADVMETHLSVTSPDEPAAAAGERMLRHKIGCLPVVRPDGRLAGIVTADDFVRWAAARMQPDGQRRSA